jgi:hypothetical protein
MRRTPVDTEQTKAQTLTGTDTDTETETRTERAKSVCLGGGGGGKGGHTRGSCNHVHAEAAGLHLLPLEQKALVPPPTTWLAPPRTHMLDAWALFANGSQRVQYAYMCAWP